MTSALDFPDWQRISILADNPALLGFNFNVAVPFTSGVVDVRQWMSWAWTGQYEAANAGPPANTGVVTFEWADLPAFANVLGRQTYEVNSVLSTDCGRTVIVDRHWGPYMRWSLAAGNGAGSTFSYVLYGSNRPVDRARVHELSTAAAQGMSTDRQAFQIRFGALAAGISRRNVRLGVGPAMLSIGVGVAVGTNFSLVLYSPELNTLGTERLYSRTGIGSGFELREPIILPRRVLTLEINNGGGTNPVVNINITVEEG